jgi:multisubunit Na+/H+ antiporter MnhG subunit
VTSVPDVPDVTGVNGDPRMDQAFKGIEKMAAQAAKMKMMGIMMIALGVVLIAIGTQLTGTIFGIPAGLVLIALGVILMGIGAMMMQQAAQMAAMAKQMGSTLAQAYGTGTYQEEAVNECTDQVLDNGGGPCQREMYRPPETSVQQDIEAERNTPVTMEGGGPVP